MLSKQLQALQAQTKSKRPATKNGNWKETIYQQVKDIILESWKYPQPLSYHTNILIPKESTLSSDNLGEKYGRKCKVVQVGLDSWMVWRGEKHF